ncbi:MAG TPA: 4a-hydroxytetrahydrobiopterin dehydratase [Candidatus Saccharimonadales bacterium]|nr:4a-hydroxytetrahydrobiopterin dehydratase [Candidatus Saccharimonadales bacterium]
MQVSGDLTHKKCVPCEGGVKPLKPDEYGSYLRTELSGWTDVDAVKIEKDYKFKDFQEALDFIARVGQIAEGEGHHPDIYLHDYKFVKLTLSTHAIGGLSENDFILASKIDQ